LVTTLLQFVLTGLAALLWLELLTQRPPALWRLVWFAYGKQLVMVGLIANMIWRQPDVLVPTIDLGAGVVLLWHALPAHVRSRPAALAAVIVAALLVSVSTVMVVDPPAQTMLQRLVQNLRGR
jgi:hypothetical protein